MELGEGKTSYYNCTVCKTKDTFPKAVQIKDQKFEGSLLKFIKMFSLPRG